MFYEFNGHRPVAHPSSFVHPLAAITGDVIIGKDVYIGPGAAIRGDWGRIIIEDGCNVQESCTIHLFPGATVRLREGAHIGHGAIVHGATIGRNCLIGMNAVIMDNADIGDGCIIGALSLVRTGEIIPARSVVVGNPGKIIKTVSDEMLGWKTEGTAIYQALPGDMQAGWKPCEPLLPEEAGEAGKMEPVENPRPYKPWREGDQGVKEPPAEAYGDRKFTVGEYLAMEKFANVKHEYHKGEVTMMSGVKLDHMQITSNLIGRTQNDLLRKGCRIFGSDLRVYVERNEFIAYPDLSIVCGKPITFENDNWNLLNPVVIIEVLSKSTAEYDRTEKFRRYQGLLSFQEYILIDSRSISVERFVRDTQGNWNSTKYKQLRDTITIGPAGISLLLEEIYEGTEFPKLTH